MYDIFLSYSTLDRDRLIPLVNILEQQGWSVFWDHRSISVGEDWHQTIGDAITKCKTVVVAWSEHSIQSKWVKEEAIEGRNRNVLYPILLEEVQQPFGFKMIQSANFSKWNGKTDFPEFIKLEERLRLSIGEGSLAKSQREVKERLEKERLEKSVDNEVKSNDTYTSDDSPKPTRLVKHKPIYHSKSLLIGGALISITVFSSYIYFNSPSESTIAANINRPSNETTNTPSSSNDEPLTKNRLPSPQEKPAFSPSPINASSFPFADDIIEKSSFFSPWKRKKLTWLGGALSSIDTSLDRTIVAVAGHREGSVNILNTLSLKPQFTKLTLSNYDSYSLDDVAILPDNKRLALAEDGQLKIFDMESKKLLQSFPQISRHYIGSLEISKDKKTLYFIRSYPPKQTSIISTFLILPDKITPETDLNYNVRVDSFDIDKDGKHYLLGTYPDNLLSFYDVENKKIVWSIKCSCSAKFNQNYNLLVFAGRIGDAAGDFARPSSIGVINVNNSTQLSAFNVDTESLEVHDISENGEFAAITSTNNGRTYIVSVSLENFKLLKIFEDHSGQSVMGAEFAKNNTLITASGDNNVRLWGK